MWRRFLFVPWILAASTVVSDAEDKAAKESPTQPPAEIELSWQIAPSLDFSPDSGLLSVLSMPGGVGIFNVSDRSESSSILRQKNSSADCVRFSPHGRTLAVSDIRGTVSFWKLSD